MRPRNTYNVLVINDLGVINGVTRYIRNLTTFLHKTGNRVFLIEGISQNGDNMPDLQKDIHRYIYTIAFQGIEDFWKITLATWKELQKIPLRQIDVIHCHHTASSLAVFLHPVARKKRIILHFHGPLYQELSSAVFPVPEYSFHRKCMEICRYSTIIMTLKYLQMYCLHKAALVISPSLYAKNLLTHVFRVKLKNIIMLHNNVDTTTFAPLPNRRKTKQSYIPKKYNQIILAVSRLDTRKGIKNIILAMPQILRIFPYAVLIIIHPSDETGSREYKKIRATISKLHIDNNVFMKSHIATKELARWYGIATICVVPSISLENNPLVALESLSCGTPVIGTPVGGISEIVTNISHSLLLQDTDAKSIANGIIRVLLYPNQKMRTLQKKSRSYIVRQHSWILNISAIISLYKKHT